MVRLITAAFLVPLLWVAIKIAPVWLFCAIAVGVIVGGCWECYRMLEVRGSRPFSWVGMLAAAAIAWSFAGIAPVVDPVLLVVSVTVLAWFLSIFRRKTPAEMLDDGLATLFPVLFVAMTLGYLLALRAVPGEDGEDLVLLLFVCVTFADTGAYYVGSTLGRHRMAPRLSPKKSWEGAAGGLCASMVAALIAHFWFYQRLPLHHALILGGVLAAFGIVGDLAESAIKRASGVKDSSALLPGHGGILDRMDSLLFAGPVLYYYHKLFLQGLA